MTTSRYQVWLCYLTHYGRLDVYCETFDKAYFFALNVPGSQDFYATCIVSDGERLRTYAKHAWERDKGFLSVEEAEDARDCQEQPGLGDAWAGGFATNH